MTAQSSTSADRSELRRKFWRARVMLRRNMWGLPLAPLRTTPDVVVIGAQRSGTTSLYRHLSDHPNIVWSSLVKSPHYFDVNYHKSDRWYQSHYPLKARMAAQSGALTGEASPYYLFHPAVAARIRATLPNAKIVAILRDPVDRAWSHYQHERARGFEDLDFDTALDLEVTRMESEIPYLTKPGFVAHHHRHHSYVSRGLYAEQLARYMDLFPAEQIKVLFTQDLKQHPQATLNTLTQFLDINSMSLEQVVQHHTRSYQPMAAATRTRLQRVFEQPDVRLGEILNRPLPWADRA